MNRRGGLGGVFQQHKHNQDMLKLGKEIENKNMDEMKKQLEIFTEKLSEFSIKYKNEIKINPDFRREFYLMCTELGVDPLAGVWKNELKLDEFYYELAIQIITISLAFKEKVGSIIDINELKDLLSKHRKKTDISEDDIIKAVESVSELKCGFEIIELQNGKRAVAITPIHLSNDTNIILQIASENNGCITYNAYKNKTGQPEYKYKQIINNLLENEMIWIDDSASIIDKIKEKYNSCSEREIYWFSGLYKYL